MNAEEHTFPMGLHLPGLLQILGEHLYSDPRVALREAVQNAHDSCTRRQMEDSAVWGPARIDVVRCEDRGCIEVRDTGSGLTRAEIHEYLATIGRSYTGRLRGELELTDEASAEELIGQFGLGLLSGFLLADEVVLETRSYQSDATSWRWTSAGGQTYELESIGERAVGTTLILKLKPAAAFLLEPGQLEHALAPFAAFLPVPVFVDDGDAALNRGNAPWHREDATLDDYWEFVRETFEVEPLTVIPLSDFAIEVGRSERTVPLRGVLFVPAGSVTSLMEFGDVAVYIRRMLICPSERDLLPSWARFVRGVVESPRLRPTVSRETLRQNSNFYEVQAGIERQLLLHFQRLAKDNPGLWRELVHGHNDLIKGWSVQDPALFAAVCDLVHFETSKGRLTLPEILSQGDGAVYYYSDETGSNQEKLLYEARGLLVVDASRFMEEAFLQRYAVQFEGVRLEQMRPGTETFFEPAEEPHLVHVAAWFRGRAIECREVRFQPSTLPVLLVYPPAHDRLQRVREVVDDGELDGPFAELMQDYLERRAPLGSDDAPVLHLNTDSELLAELESVGLRSLAFAPALELIFQSARFMAGKRMSPPESRRAAEVAMGALSSLLGLAKRGEPPARETE